MNEKLNGALRKILSQSQDALNSGWNCSLCKTEQGTHKPGCPISLVSDHLAALDAEKGETVRVRIAVAVESDGRWMSYGDNDDGDKSKAHTAIVNLEAWNPWEVHFIEADIPLPKPTEPQTIEGTVTKAEA